MNTWTIEVADGPDDPWVEVVQHRRFSQAVRIFNDLVATRKRLLRNGRCLRMATDPNELDLLHEEDA